MQSRARASFEIPAAKTGGARNTSLCLIPSPDVEVGVAPSVVACAATVTAAGAFLPHVPPVLGVDVAVEAARGRRIRLPAEVKLETVGVVGVWMPIRV